MQPLRRDFACAQIERHEGLVEIRLHTREGPLLWDGEVVRELCELFGQLARDPEVRVVILTGTGNVYCEMGMALDPLPVFTARSWEDVRWQGEQLLANLLAIQAPVIACINGPVTSHPEIPLLSDIVLAAQDADVQDAGHFIFNVAPTDGLHIAMPLLMGLTRARYFLFTGQKLTARAALDMGLVNELLPREQLLPRARQLAAHMLERNPLVLRYTRLALTHHLKSLFHHGMGYGAALEGLAIIDEGAQQAGR